MRWVIAGASFLVPMLLVVAIGSCFADPPAGPASGAPALPRQRMDGLRRLVAVQAVLLDRYAPAPGGGQPTAIPHLALDAFDLRGSDEQGRAWYRLAQPPAPDRHGGVLRRAADDRRPPGTIDGRAPTVLAPLAAPWWYWETAAAETAKSP